MGFIIGFIIGILISGIRIAPVSCDQCTQIAADMMVPIIAIAGLILLTTIAYNLLMNKIEPIFATIQLIAFLILVFIIDEITTVILIARYG